MGGRPGRLGGPAYRYLREALRARRGGDLRSRPRGGHRPAEQNSRDRAGHRPGDRRHRHSGSAAARDGRGPAEPAGSRSGGFFDINAVCSGFVYGLTIASALLSSSSAFGTYALVVGSDMFSSVMDRTDRRTVSLFGDGAGAALLGPVPEGYGIGASRMVAHGSLRSLVEVPAGGTRKPLTPEARAAGEHLFKMDGRPVAEYALRALPEVIGATLADDGLSIEDIDRFIFHQANVRLLENITSELKLDPDRVPMTAPQYGNTGAASIPITMRDAQLRRPFRRGERILLAAVGGGMTAAATVLTWF